MATNYADPQTGQAATADSRQQTGAGSRTGQIGSKVRQAWQPSGAQDAAETNLARGLGWFSIGLGVAQIAAHRSLAKLIGVKDRPVLFSALGLREIASGISILMQSCPAGPLWARVGGDAMDLALLGAAFTSRRADRARLAMATAAVAGITAIDVVAAQRFSENRGVAGRRGAIRVRKSITINSSPEELYQFWHDFENLPRFMKHLNSVRVTGDRRSHWVAKAPAGTTVEWDAETIEDRPNELIAWRSVENADVDNSGSVRFEHAPGGRGAVVRVEMQYSPPGGMLGSLVAKLFGEEPQQQLHDELRRFKQVIETGEVLTTEGQPAGRSSSTSWLYDRTVRGSNKEESR